MNLFKRLFKIWAFVTLVFYLSFYPEVIKFFFFIVTPLFLLTSILAGLYWLINERSDS